MMGFFIFQHVDNLLGKIRTKNIHIRKITTHQKKQNNNMRQLKITQQITVRDTKSLDKYLSDVSSVGDVITSEQEIELSKRIQEGDEEALHILVKANLRFAISVAKQYQGQGVTLEDLINEGNIGLIKAAQKFDYTRGFKFISYAVWWIRQSILQFLAENKRIVYLPGNKISQINKLNKASARLEQEIDRLPTAQELAERLSDEFTQEQVRDILSLDTTCSSIDVFVGDDSSTRASDGMATSAKESITDHAVESDDLNISIKRALQRLTHREKFIIESYYGILGKDKKTLEEIGQYLDLTRERVRQIKNNAERRLRFKGAKDILREYA